MSWLSKAAGSGVIGGLLGAAALGPVGLLGGGVLGMVSALNRKDTVPNAGPDPKVPMSAVGYKGSGQVSQSPTAGKK